MKEFPNTLYVKIEHEREPEDDFLVSSGDVTDLAEQDENVQVAVYDLVMVKTAANKTELVN